MNPRDESLIDFYAGKALIGLLAADAGAYSDEETPVWFEEENIPSLAQVSFDIAEAMIKEREARVSQKRPPKLP